MSSYRDLTVWQKSMDLVDVIYALCKQLPREETYCLSDQMRRSAVSIPSNIAEGQKRSSAKDFSHFLSISAGSCAELETQLFIATRQNMLTEEQIQPALQLTNEISHMLAAMIGKLRNA